MKFDQLTNESYGARNAGFVIDFDYKIEWDADLFAALKSKRGEDWASGFVDSFHDFDGDLFIGEDGNYYHVALDYAGNAPYVPVMWRRLKRAEPAEDKHHD